MSSATRYDLGVLGSGFGGSILAWLATKIGMRVLLLERGEHPRFAIGESSTPLADMILRDLADRYDAPELKPLGHWGTWQETYPDLVGGPKRGFGYYQHRPGRFFTSGPNRANELMVAASPDESRGDSHWLRSEVDRFLVERAIAAGVEFRHRRRLLRAQMHPPWKLSVLNDKGKKEDYTVDMMVDATGASVGLSSSLDLADVSGRLLTRTRSMYTHLIGVGSWDEVYRRAGGDTSAHPYPCDAAAVHHLLDGAWFWMLRFNNEVTSVGLTLDNTKHPPSPKVTADEEWSRWQRSYPAIHAMLCDAQMLQPLKSTKSNQRLWDHAVGRRAALLPSAFGFIDPLHSTGIAHNLSGIERLLAAFQDSHPTRLLRRYGQQVMREFRHIDRLIHGCYATMHDFQAFTAFAMYYFAAATTNEARRRRGDELGGFLLADEEAFTDSLHRAHAHVLADDTDTLIADATVELEPYNHAGLWDFTKKNMYPYLP